MIIRFGGGTEKNVHFKLTEMPTQNEIFCFDFEAFIKVFKLFLK